MSVKQQEIMPYTAAHLNGAKTAATISRPDADNSVQEITAPKLLPREVYLMCVHGAYIAGSQAKRLAGEQIDVDSSDYDVLVPLDKWQTIALMIPQEARPNKFGGWRFKTDKGVEIDVWTGDPMKYLSECKTKYGGAVYLVDYINNRVFSSNVRELG